MTASRVTPSDRRWQTARLVTAAKSCQRDPTDTSVSRGMDSELRALMHLLLEQDGEKRKGRGSSRRCVHDWDEEDRNRMFRSQKHFDTAWYLLRAVFGWVGAKSAVGASVTLDDRRPPLPAHDHRFSVTIKDGRLWSRMTSGVFSLDSPCPSNPDPQWCYHYYFSRRCAVLALLLQMMFWM